MNWNSLVSFYLIQYTFITSNVQVSILDYDDPNYSVDQGIIEGEEYYNPASASWEEEEIESMREERRRQNDLFQFNVSSIFLLLNYI